LEEGFPEASTQLLMSNEPIPTRIEENIVHSSYV